MLAALVVAACAAPARDPPAPPPLEVGFGGCRTVHEGPICFLPVDLRLRLWVRSPPDVVLTLSGGAHQLLQRSPAEEGSRLRVALDGTASALVVRATTPEGGKASWRLALRPFDVPPWLVRTENSGIDQDPALLLALLQESLTTPLTAPQRAFTLHTLALLLRGQGDTAGAERHLRTAITVARDAGCLLDEVESRTALAYWLIASDRLHEARALLDGLPTAAHQPAEALFHRDYYRGVLASRVGDHRAALYLLDEATRRATRLGLAKLVRNGRQMLAVAQRQAGEGPAAAALLERLWATAPATLAPCERAQLANNIGWRRLLAYESGDGVARDLETSDPIPPLMEALALLQQACPRLHDEPANVHTNLALAYLQTDDLQRARSHLEAARLLAPEPELRQQLWQRDLAARIALAEDRPRQALAEYDAMAVLADVSLSPAAQWRAAVGRGRAHGDLGEVDGALDQLARAEALLDDASLAVPLATDRAAFVAQREQGTRLYLDLLLRAGHHRQAFAIARRARIRILNGLRRGERLSTLPPAARQRWDDAVARYHAERQALDEAARDAWRLPADQLRQREHAHGARRRALQRVLDEALHLLVPSSGHTNALPALAPGEVRLLYHPLPTGWVGFAEDATGLEVAQLPLLNAALPPDRLARQLLTPFADKLTAARQVRVLPYGFLRDVDFHALPFGGATLLATKPVVYSLDLGAPSAAGVVQPRHALLVADPNGDLAAAAAEARHVHQALAGRLGEESVLVLTAAAATGTAVRQALAHVDLFHYAGHGSLAGWESALPLAAGSRLTLGDILALGRAPRQVVLSGCDTGRTATRGHGVDATGFAHAFLVAGSRSVIAATRPVEDEEALALVNALYPALLQEASPPAALRRAQLAFHRQHPDADWASFRIFEP